MTPRTPTGKPLLKVQGLSKRFGGLAVIDDVSFTIPAGRRTALLGPNGAGKTVMFNLLTGIYPIDAGEVRLAGRDLTHEPSAARIRHGMARTFQNVRLVGHLTAYENVLLGHHHRARGIRGLLEPILVGSGGHTGREALAALDEAGLGRHAHTAVGNLPFGVRKQVELVRAMIAGPELLLLDEPAAGLNAAETAVLRRQLETIAGAGVTPFVIEHDMEFVGDFCDHVIALNFGQKIAEGTPDEVRRDRQVRAAYLGDLEASGA